jgi:hypothetical protein
MRWRRSTGPSQLERGYRRVLACYPKAFRHESEDEILAVLLATAAEGQRRVGLVESADLLMGAARMHLGLSRSPRPVRNAVRLMCLGAVLTLADVVTALVTLGDVIATTVLWLAGAGGGAAHLQRDGQPALPAPGSNASSNTGERNRTVAGQLDNKCLLMLKDWTDSDGSGHGRACLLIRGSSPLSSTRHNSLRARHRFRSSARRASSSMPMG